MSARKQISLEFKDTAEPFEYVLHMAKENIWFCFKKQSVLEAAKKTENDVTQIQQIPANDNLFSFLLYRVFHLI